jgi:hypothetical protein
MSANGISLLFNFVKSIFFVDVLTNPFYLYIIQIRRMTACMSSKVLLILVTIVKFSTLGSGQSCQLANQKHYNYQDVKSILDKNKCNACHQTGSNTNCTYQVYNNFFEKDQCGQKIVSSRDVLNSSLVDKINGGNIGCGHSMPLGGTPISAADLLAIESWIQYGAPEFCVENFEKIKSILHDDKCKSCHYNGSITAPSKFDNYSDFFSTSASCGIPLVQKFDASQSLLFQKIDVKSELRCGARMFKEGVKVDDLNVAKIRDWINAGAPEFSAILPVSLAYFEVKSTSNSENINISWTTLAEVNTSHFVVQHSFDGSTYTDVERVEASGALGDYYSLKDTRNEQGFHYYRLKIFDFDNTFSMSQVRVIRIENKSEIFNIYPSIITSTMSIDIQWYPSDSREIASAQIMDIQGNLYAIHRITLGNNIILLPELKTGVYYVVLTNYSGRYNAKRFVVVD